MTAVPQTGFRNDIQGLRAIAVLAVVIYHSGASVLSGGYVGVDMFFVISGYLITDHLYRGFTSSHGIRLRDFYVRRVMRILPASLVVLVLTLLASLILLPPMLLDSTLVAAAAAAFYVPNMYFAATGTDYLSETVPSVFQHYWSLGIEEQFYVFWPFVILASLVVTARSRRWLVPLLSTVVVISFILGALLTYRSQPWAFFSLPTRAWELGVGGLLAIILARLPATATIGPRARGALAVVGVVGVLISLVAFNATTTFPGFAAALPVLSTALLILAGAHGNHLLSSLLGNPVAKFVGAISYSVYLVHWPVLVLTQASIGYEQPLPLWATLALGASSIPLGYVSYRFVEQPFRRSRPKRLRARRTLVIGLAVPATVASACLLIVPITSGTQLSADETLAPATVQIAPTSSAYVPANLTPSLRNASDSVPVSYADGCHDNTFTNTIPRACNYRGADANAVTVALVGDSHAAQWTPALRRLVDRGEISLTIYTKSSCPAAAYPVRVRGVPYTQCDDFRQAVIDDIHATAPDIVLIAAYGDGYEATSSDGDFAHAWALGIDTFVGALPAETEPILLLDTPGLPATPAICLSANLESPRDCAASRASALGSEARTVERELSMAHIDMSEYFCGETSCPVVVGDTLVYRDSHHITTEWAEHLATPLGDALISRLD